MFWKNTYSMLGVSQAKTLTVIDAYHLPLRKTMVQVVGFPQYLACPQCFYLLRLCYIFYNIKIL